MNQNYPPFPPYGYSSANASGYQPPNGFTAYSTATPQQLQHPNPHRQGQQAQSQFFSSLPQGTAAQQQQQRQRHSSDGLQNGVNRPSSPPPVPNGPGAPPPEPSSPPDLETNLFDALRQEQGNSGDGATQDATQDNDDDVEDQDEEGNEDDPVYQLPPPPEQVYPNADELEKAMHAWSLDHGYELVRRASKKNARGQLYKRYFHCSRHGKVASQKASEKTKVRVNRKSNRIGCPMSLAAVSVDPHDPSGNWQIRHRKTHHNHPAVDAIKLAGHRRRARMGTVEKAVDGLFAINTSTGDVLKFLQRTNPDGLFNRTDVANMKLKYNKYGTCAQKGGDPPPAGPIEKHAHSAKSGFPSACDSCRSKKTKCDSMRPVCGACARAHLTCHYNHQPHPRAQQPRGGNARARASNAQAALQNNMEGHAQAGASNGAQTGMRSSVPLGMQGPDHQDDQSMMDLDNNAMDTSGYRALPNIPVDLNQQSAQQAEQILATLANFQQEHVKPSRLSLESSSVEVLANSTCGNGDSYKSVAPRPFSLGADWRLFRENFEAAAVKENAYDALIGDKKEPTNPNDGEGEVSVTDHNEYIKQLAIYKRRNDMLKIALRESLHPSLWSRISKHSHAHEMWTQLEDMCLPRGSDQAYQRFSDLFQVTHQQCGTLDNYIYALESRFNEFNLMAQTHETHRNHSALNQSHSERLKRAQGGDGTFPEWILCFLFLKNLAPQHQGLARNLCMKNNLGGYGSGERMTFKELAGFVRRAVEWETQRNGAIQR
ncbi:ATP-dependent helicase [Lecanosticta acicola]|uniref:ATP-dependent helicase n=1 Tax=Lecanosticta acicola TaxID=111012 RepID=A0AAI8Z0A4_9PEZI|nr:ATP-dependent helicase [Lecanosticta acicola]